MPDARDVVLTAHPLRLLRIGTRRFFPPMFFFKKHETRNHMTHGQPSPQSAVVLYTRVSYGISSLGTRQVLCNFFRFCFESLKIFQKGNETHKRDTIFYPRERSRTPLSSVRGPPAQCDSNGRNIAFFFCALPGPLEPAFPGEPVIPEVDHATAAEVFYVDLVAILRRYVRASSTLGTTTPYTW